MGLNYADHAEESGADVPRAPVIFSSATSSLSGPYDAVLIPDDAHQLDWEVELGVVISQTARRLPDEASTRDHIAGYTIVHDVSERAWQSKESSQWMIGESCEHSVPPDRG